MALLDDIKTELSITNTKKDNAIQATIEAGKRELEIAGVQNVWENDALTVRALVLYCKAAYNFQGEGERYRQHFEMLRDAMALAGEYRSGNE